MVNGKGKSHVKLYLDHDFCRLANLPLASSSLWAQLLQALWAWHWMLSCCLEKWVSQVHSAQAAMSEKEREREGSEPLRLITNQTKLHFLSIIIKFYRAMLEIRYDPPFKVYARTSCQLQHDLLPINIVASVNIVCRNQQVLRCAWKILSQMLRYYVTFVVILASYAALGNGI